jgi:hypothetical protein
MTRNRSQAFCLDQSDLPVATGAAVVIIGKSVANARLHGFDDSHRFAAH